MTSLRRRAPMLLAPFLLLGAGAACDMLYPGDPPPGAHDQPGYAAYREYCGRCHGLDGRSERASRIADEPVDLADPAWKAGATREGIERVIRRGTGKMEGLEGRMEEDEIRDVVDYLLWMPARPAEGGR